MKRHQERSEDNKENMNPAPVPFSLHNTVHPATLNRGVVRLSISVKEADHLTVHVHEACLSSSKLRTACNKYIEVSLFEEGTKTLSWQTEESTSNENLKFEESCTLALMAEDGKKRLMVSMLDKNEKDSCSDQLIGCMSFGVRHLVTKSHTKHPDGWYCLLPENVGRRKHLAAKNVHTPSKDQQNVPDTSIQWNSMADHTITIPRNASGFGFTVKGSCPVRIGHVKSDGSALKVGLCKGDLIIQINRKDVSRSSAESVAEIIRESTKMVILDVKRSTEQQSKPKLSRSSKKAKVDLNQAILNTEDAEEAFQDENIPPLQRPNVPGTASLKDISGITLPSPKMNTKRQDKTDKSMQHLKHRNIYSDLSSMNESGASKLSRSKNCTRLSDLVNGEMESYENIVSKEEPAPKRLRRKENRASYTPKKSQPLDKSYTNWNPDMSVISNMSTRQRFMESGFHEDLSDSHSEEDLTRVSLDSMWTPGTHVPNATLPNGAGDATLMDPNLISMAADDNTLWEDFVNQSIQNLNNNCDKRMSAIQRLLSCEKQFSRQMQCGIQRFSRPLRHAILSQKQHQMLFQNIEKLVAMSEYNIRQMLDQTFCADSTAHSISMVSEEGISLDVGAIYKQRIWLLCEFYESYVSGLRSAHRLLHDLEAHPLFEHFMQNHPEMRLAGFLDHPVQHMQDLILCLESVLDQTDPMDPDHQPLQYVMQAMDRMLHKMNI